MYERDKLIGFLLAVVFVLSWTSICDAKHVRGEASSVSDATPLNDGVANAESQQVALVASHDLTPAEGNRKDVHDGAKHYDYHKHHEKSHDRNHKHKGESLHYDHEDHERKDHGKRDKSFKQGFQVKGGKHDQGHHHSHKHGGKHHKFAEGGQLQTKGHEGSNRKGYLHQGYDDLLHKENGGYKGETNYGGSYFVPFGGSTRHSNSGKGHAGGHHGSGGQHGAKHHGHGSHHGHAHNDGHHKHGGHHHGHHKHGHNQGHHS